MKSEMRRERVQQSIARDAVAIVAIVRDLLHARENQFQPTHGCNSYNVGEDFLVSDMLCHSDGNFMRLRFLANDRCRRNDDA